jgi:signal transduction histidine kinase/DNA-binding NtrC family response regulator
MESNPRVLVVDDHRSIHADIKKLLETAPPSRVDEVEHALFDVVPAATVGLFTVDSAFQGNEGAAMVGRARAEGRPYALAIVDMRMPPGWDGLQTVEQMWAMDPELQVVICTAYSDTSWHHIRQRFSDHHRFLILMKPFAPIELCQMVGAMTEKWHLAQQARLRLDELGGMVEERTRELREAHESLQRFSDTELAKRSAELARSLALAHEIQEAVADGILVVDENGKVVSVNRKFGEIWRVPDDRIATGDDHHALLDYAVSQLVEPEAFLARVRYLYTHPTESGIEDIRLSDGRTFERWTGPVRGADDTILGRLWCFRDVSERRRLDAEHALITERMASMGRIAASVGHEINNPLAYVMGNVEWLAQQLTEPRRDTSPVLADELSEVVGAVRAGLDQIRSIVSDLQALTRGADDVRSSVEIGPILGQSLQMAAPEIRHRAQVVRQIEGGVTVTGSPSRLGQLFLNLLINAAHAIPEGHVADNVIRVSCRTERNTVVVEVADTGSGIAEEHIARVFDPFFTTKAVGSGSGLGLSICKGIVEAHGGTLAVTSQLGSGSTFVVRLPTVAVRTTESETRRSASTADRRSRVLIIDDQPLLVQMLTRVLSSRHQVTSSTSPREALARLGNGETFDVVLCDLMMDDMTGMDLYDVVVREHPAVANRIVFMTGGTFTPRASTFADRAPNGVIKKPFDVPRLLETIERVASRAS